MAPVTMLFGGLLIVLGLTGYFSPDTLGVNDPSKQSPTALIPAGIGAVLLICGLIAACVPKSRKHVMHIAVLVALIGAAGGFMPIMRGGLELEKAAVKSGIGMVALCAVFIVLCVRSFILARIARAEGFPEKPA